MPNFGGRLCFTRIEPTQLCCECNGIAVKLPGKLLDSLSPLLFVEVMAPRLACHIFDESCVERIGLKRSQPILQGCFELSILVLRFKRRQPGMTLLHQGP